MDLTPGPQELRFLQDVWREQAPAVGPLVDYSDQVLSIPLRQAVLPAAPAALEGLFAGLWGWPEWVRVYARPPQAVLAASRLARDQGRGAGVLWMAPGAGAPLDPPKGPPGVAMLRCDWMPGASAAQAAAAEARSRGLLLVVDETITGLRLASGGACQALGLQPEAVLWAPRLPGGRRLGLLAGRGPAPPAAAAEPDAPTRQAAAMLLAWATETDVPARLEVLGRSLAMGLAYFAARTGLTDQVALEGPLRLPRLSGRRLWAFLGLAKQERLRLAPLVMLDPFLDQMDSQELVWPRLARACARLRVLPEGAMAPLGWREAGPDSCRAVQDILENLNS
ncbi:MAG: hypothetical protein AB1814_11125 [Thermodesulfobacteriota bacterium]